MRLILAAVFALILAPALAAEMRFECRNPRRPYLVRFDPQKRTLVIHVEEGDTAYKVDDVYREEAGYGVFGVVPGVNLRFNAHFGISDSAENGIVFVIPGRPSQGDTCRPLN